MGFKIPQNQIFRAFSESCRNHESHHRHHFRPNEIPRTMFDCVMFNETCV